jgi:hypothetical protein
MPIDLVVDERDTASTSGGMATPGAGGSIVKSMSPGGSMGPSGGGPGGYHPGSGDMGSHRDQVCRCYVYR